MIDFKQDEDGTGLFAASLFGTLELLIVPGNLSFKI